MFDLRKIEAFCKVCEHRSFSKAGEALFLSQPTVSAHIQALEREFEVRLLDRMGRTVLPTPAGVVLYRYAKLAISRLEAARAEIRALAHEVTGELRIGSSSIPAYHVLPRVLSSFTRVHPLVRPSLVVASSKAVLRQVLEGELMAGIVSSDILPVPDIIDTPILDSEIVVIAPADITGLPACPLPASEEDPLPEISFDAARSLQWILREDNSTTRRAFGDALRLAGHDVRLLQPKLTVDSAHAAFQYVRAGLGVATAARVAVQGALARGDIRAFTLTGVRAVRQFSCITNARRVPFPAATVFLEHLYNDARHMHVQPRDDTA